MLCQARGSAVVPSESGQGLSMCVCLIYCTYIVRMFCTCILYIYCTYASAC